MLQLEKKIGDYLEYCEYQKNLSPHTLKAYRIDLSQFLQFAQGIEEALHKSNLSRYYVHLHKEYQPKSVKRKIACLKAFCSWLEYEEIIEQNPFFKLKIKYQEPRLLPRTIPIHVIQTLLSAAYDDLKDARTAYQSRSALPEYGGIGAVICNGGSCVRIVLTGGGGCRPRQHDRSCFGEGIKGAGYPDWESSGVADFEEISIRAFSSDLRIGFLFCESG